MLRKVGLYGVLGLIVVQSQLALWWMVLNQEVVAEKIARTLVGSLALVFAVPITTCFTAYYYGTRKNAEWRGGAEDYNLV